MPTTPDVFEKVLLLARDSAVRFVAINRRDYPGSSPFAEAKLAVLKDGTDDQKASFVRDRGVELATFIHCYSQQHLIPPLSKDAATGGFTILCWSLGNSNAVAAVSSVEELPPDIRSYFVSNLRALILQGML